MAYYLYKKIRDHGKAKNADASEKLAPTSNPGYDAANVARSNDEQDANVDVDISQPRDSQTPMEGTEKPILVDTEADAARRREKAELRTYRWKIIAGLFLPLLVFALNKTMIAAALPFIASDFHQFAQLNWIISAAELTSTAFVPAWGQFADIFGRYLPLQTSVIIMIIGSALSAGAPTTNFPMLLAGRGFQGVGIAGMMTITHMVLSDKVSLKDNAANNTIFALIVGIGYGIGPVIGGYLTSVSWRWVFILNIPIGALGLFVTHFTARTVMLGPRDVHDRDESSAQNPTLLARLSTIDFGGQVLFLFGMGLLILALTWAGAYYPWDDVHVLAPLVIGALFLLSFILWEYLLLPGHALSEKFPDQQPMIALDLLFTRNAGILVYINIITGMAMYAVFYFVDLYFTIVQDFGPGKAGNNLLYYLPGLGVGSYASMFICNVWPRKTWYPLSSGTIIEAVGITLIAAALHWNHLPVVYGMLALTGVGTGIRFMPNTLHAVGYHRRNIATVISLMSLSMSFGSTLASTIMLNIFNNRMSHAGISLVHGASSASSFNSINQLPLAQQTFVRTQANKSLVVAFYGISSFMWLGVIAVVFLGNVNISKDKKSDSSEDGETNAENLTKGAYIGSLFRRRRGQENGEKA